LKRSLAQSCDPHTAFISVELGSFEDTIGRLNSSLDLRKGSRSSTFAYRVKIKVPVDTVGMRRYPIDWNQEKRDLTGSSDSGNLGWVIIRVALRRGIKVVTIESPLILKNTSDVDLLCEVRDHDGLSLMWRSLVPRERHEASGYVPVPADIVPIIHSKAYRFSVVALAKEPRVRHESEVPPCDKTLFSRLQAPRPYSRNSLTKGIIDQSHIGVRQLLANESGRRPFYMTGNVNLNLCSIRIGSIALDQASRAVASTSDLEIPEQRMLLFRSTLAVSNHLPYPLRVQVRVKVEQSTTGVSSREAQLRSSWFELGVLDCGEVTNWTGASATDKIEIRVGFSEGKSTLLPALVSWSSVSLIPSLEESSFLPSSSSRLGFMALPELKLPGAYDVPAPLHISTALTRGYVAADLATASTSVKTFSTSVPEAGRVVGLYVPFWIVDETGLDLQFKSGLFSSAQEGLYRHRTSRREHSQKLQAALGLGELLDDNNMTHLPSRNAYEVFMIGNEGSNRLYVRRRTSRFLNVIAPWSDPIPLTLSDNHFYDTNVFPPALSIGEANDDDHLVNDDSETFALRSRLLQAPASLGGRYGTRFVHVVCRYAIVNQLCREIEISGTDVDSKPTAVVPCFHPTPIHFNDTKPIRFRPKEFGWAWSGRFHVRRSRREVTLFLAHKIKGTKILVTVEIVSKQKPGTCILIFRESPYSPYRLENRTVFALHYRQISSLFEVDAIPRNLNSSPGPILLPYHDAEFAWDEPESSRHSIALSIADLGEQFKDKSSLFIGSVRIDRIAPGTTFRLRSGRFTGQVISDGPTRVLRIMESQKSESPNHADDLNVEESSTTGLTWMLTAKLLHGVGVSLVDWVPQELVYLKLEDVFIEKLHGGTERKLTSAIGRIVVNNQLWVTPYPVALRVGSQSQRRRHRRHSALSLSWNRREASGTGRGNMTMFQFIEFSMEPITLFVDGNLTNHLIGMYRQAKAIGLATNAREGAMLRNQVLNETLGLQEDVYLRSDLVVNPHRTVVDDLYYTGKSSAEILFLLSFPLTLID
jgi:SHR-binding domain of vacuolar-sorting associated protein 13